MADLHDARADRLPRAGGEQIPDHLTVTDAGVRTVQLISPGDALPVATRSSATCST